MPDHTTNEIPYGYCHCGCGQKTSIAKFTNNKVGQIRGEPVRYIPGHNGRKPIPTPPNPSGLCMCGCGQPVPIATKTRINRGHVKGFPLRFIVGHGRTFLTLADAFWAYVTPGKNDECWEFHKRTDRAWYGQVCYRKQHIFAHRVSWMLHYGPVPEGLEVCHKCDNPACINPNHLFLGTHADNMRDMLAKGRSSKPPRNDHKGEKAPCARFTNAKVRELRSQFDDMDISITKYARLHGVSSTAMSKILRRITYRDVLDESEMQP